MKSLVLVLVLSISNFIYAREYNSKGVDFSYSYKGLSWIEYSWSHEKNTGLRLTPFHGAHYKNINIYGVGIGLGYNYFSKVKLWTANYEHSLHRNLTYGTNAIGKLGYRVLGQSIYQVGIIGSLESLEDISLRLRYSNRIFKNVIENVSMFLFLETTIGSIDNPVALGVKIRWNGSTKKSRKIVKEE